MISLITNIAIMTNTSEDDKISMNTLNTNYLEQPQVIFNLSSISVMSKGRVLRPNNFFIFLICGDINPNPGPTNKIQCSCCFRTIAKNHRFVKCTKCELSFHIKCASVKVELLSDPSNSFICNSCLNDKTPV